MAVTARSVFFILFVNCVAGVVSLVNKSRWVDGTIQKVPSIYSIAWKKRKLIQ